MRNAELLGGFVLFGVSDDGRIAGQQVCAGTLEDVVRELRRIQPQAAALAGIRRSADGRAVVLIRVPRGEGPYAYDGRAYVRMGPATVQMAAEHYQRTVVERMHPARRWETLAGGRASSLDDLDADEVIRTAAGGHAPQPASKTPARAEIEDLLLGFGLLRGGEIPSTRAVVLFGRSDRLAPLYPQCTLRMARFRGRDIVRVHRQHGRSRGTRSISSSAGTAVPARPPAGRGTRSPRPVRARGRPALSRRWHCARRWRTPSATATTAFTAAP